MDLFLRTMVSPGTSEATSKIQGVTIRRWSVSNCQTNRVGLIQKSGYLLSVSVQMKKTLRELSEMMKICRHTPPRPS